LLQPAPLLRASLGKKPFKAIEWGTGELCVERGRCGVGAKSAFDAPATGPALPRCSRTTAQQR